MNVNRKLPLLYSVLRVTHVRLRLAVALLLPLAFYFPATAAQPTNSPSRPDYSAFKLITERNIFDPRRSRQYRPTRTDRPRPRAEYLTLVGIMSYDGQGPMAFFDGTSSQYQKVLKPSDSIAGYKVTRIEPAYVKLAVGSNEFQLPLGMQLRRDSEGKWQLAEPTELPPERSERSERPSFVRGAPQPLGPRTGPPSLVTNEEPQMATTDAEPPPPAFDPQLEAGGPPPPPEAATNGGETDPVLLRLMQRRAQEAGQ
jgi:hypothetical protein